MGWYDGSMSAIQYHKEVNVNQIQGKKPERHMILHCNQCEKLDGRISNLSYRYNVCDVLGYGVAHLPRALR